MVKQLKGFIYSMNVPTITKAQQLLVLEHEAGVALNEVQRQAVLHTEGPMLLLATPGSGKTMTLIMKIGFLIEACHIPANRIKAITFSRAAATHMQERFQRFFPTLPTASFSTIHSLAYEIVRDYLYEQRKAYTLIEGRMDEKEYSHAPNKLMILRQLYFEMTEENLTEDQMEELTTFISYVKNKMLPMSQWATVKCNIPHAFEVMKAYEHYKQEQHSTLLLDYDDMLVVAYNALEENPVLLHKYQVRHDYVLTDESQDTSLLQYAIIEQLVKEHHNLCVVGDDDQSIYSWRGAEPSYLLQFKKKFPDCNVLFMEQNYRSTSTIVQAANVFIKRNKERYDKSMFTHNEVGEQIVLKTCQDAYHQLNYLIEEIQQYSANGDYAEVAVLYRNHNSSILLMNQFERAGIPFYAKDGDFKFFSHWVVSDILNLMRMTFTDKRVDIFEQIYMKINGYLTKAQMKQLTLLNQGESVFETLLSKMELKDYQRKQLEEVRDVLTQMKDMPPVHAIAVIRERLGYEKAILRMSERLGFNAENLIGILDTLAEIAEPLDTMVAFANRLKELELLMKQSRFHPHAGAVTFSTFHSAKGLEFERVYMIDLIDGVIPSAHDTGKKGSGISTIEEAARLFYVGMTRAKSHLELISYTTKENRKIAESIFMTSVKQYCTQHGGGEIRPAVDTQGLIHHREELALGTHVNHREFGMGTLISIDHDYIKVNFGTVQKTLSLALCLELGLLEKM
ncbi:DNA helicase-2/ATP-dependent DNA helicase PcrA [Paenibacillus turicensis]|uniref:DNA 3'-5' helicase n=2 Tax=Paenibacillus turicensis TaxID=160487 RepID=A0ABS4FSL2_9BACL|nr:DNA helicase-2/ATP-dependent DNA helicase PcrA [Paenibacillus turicensis]